MKDYKELIKSFTKEDFQKNKINLHIHSKYSDGEADFLDIIKQSKEKGFKHIAITDHNTVQGYLDNPHIQVISGVEFDVWYKYIFLHLLAYGIDVKHPEMQKFYAQNKSETEADIVRLFAKRNIEELISGIHNAGGIAVLAHPCCCWAINLERFIKDLINIGLDGVEVYYPYPRWRKYIKFSNPEQVEKIADKFHLIKTGGTDCHSKEL